MGFHDTKGFYHAFRSVISLSLNDFREVDVNSDVGAIAANGGLLASDTTPILRGNTAETQEIAWAASNSDIIATQIRLPNNFDGSQDVWVELDVLGAGVTDPATFTVESGWDGGTLVSDSASDALTKAITVHRITAVIAAADIPDTAKNLTLVLTLGAHTTDVVMLQGVGISYVAKTTS